MTSSARSAAAPAKPAWPRARASAEAEAARRSGHHEAAARHEALAASYQAMEAAYRQRESVFAGVTADRADWEAATRAQRHLAVAADAELRRRHPDQRFTPLRSAEPRPAAGARRAELTLTPGKDIPEPGQWIKDLAAGRRTFADRLADRQSLMIPSEDPGYGSLGQASRPGPDSRKERSCSRRNRRSARHPGSWSASWTATPTWKPGNDGLAVSAIRCRHRGIRWPYTCLCQTRVRLLPGDLLMHA